MAVLAAGVVTPLGPDLDSFWSGLLGGGDALTPIERFRTDDLRVGRGGEIKKLPAVATGVRSRAAALLVAAAADLKSRARLGDAPERIAVVVGTALGGVEELERALQGDGTPRRALDALYDAPAHVLADWLGARGPVLTVSAACASGATALGVGADLLREGAADLVVAGGYDILCRFVLRGFDVLRSLTRERVRPFDRRRSGLLLGEAAGLVLLARERDVRGPRLGRPGGGDPRRAGGGRRRRRRSRLRQRARHRHAAERPDRGSRAAPRAGPARGRDPRQLDQGRSRSHHGRRRRAGGDHVPAGRARRRDPAHRRLRGAGSGL